MSCKATVTVLPCPRIAWSCQLGVFDVDQYAKAGERSKFGYESQVDSDCDLDNLEYEWGVLYA